MLPSGLLRSIRLRLLLVLSLRLFTITSSHREAFVVLGGDLPLPSVPHALRFIAHWHSTSQIKLRSGWRGLGGCSLYRLSKSQEPSLYSHPSVRCTLLRPGHHCEGFMELFMTQNPPPGSLDNSPPSLPPT